MRKWLKTQRVTEIVDFGDLPVFQNATTYPCILQIEKNHAVTSFRVAQIKSLDFTDLSETVESAQFPVSVEGLEDKGWTLTHGSGQTLLKKLREVGVPLEKYVNKQVYYGIKTGLNEAFVIDAATRTQLLAEDPKSADVVKPFLIGREVKRFTAPVARQFLILMPRGWTRQHSANAKDAWVWLRENYAAVANYLQPFADAAEKRCDKGEYWWELRACDYYDRFEEAKIIYPNICKRPEFTFDTSGLYTNQKCFIIPVADKYLLGVLNSSLCFYLLRHILPKLRGDFYEPSYVYFKDFPIRHIDFNNAADVERHTKMVSLVEQMLSLHAKLAVANSTSRTVLQRQVETTDAQIDRLVYALYGLSAEEIAIVESVG